MIYSLNVQKYFPLLQIKFQHVNILVIKGITPSYMIIKNYKSINSK